ncbi:MAG: glycosyltransferase family 39 protein [Bacteroidota bacterium]
MVSTKKRKSYYHWGVILITALMAFAWLGNKGVFAWDEARYGENAYWMNAKGDYVNFYFANQPDKWNAKPPLANWLIALNYQWIGHNPWALRLHSAISIVLFFAIFFAWVRRYRGSTFASITCAVLLTVKGIIGHHVGRTGDTDALLLLWLMGFLYAFSAWVDFGERKMLLWGAICLGLAFYSKGPTFIFYLPGAAIYLLLRRRLAALLSESYFWVGIGSLLAIIASWIILVEANSPDDGNNSWQTLLFYDTIARFTETGVEGAATSWNAGFVFEALDIKFNLWNYLMYASLILFSVRRSREHKLDRLLWQKDEYRIFLLSLSIAISLSVVLTISQSKLVWYITPILPFAALAVSSLIIFSVEHSKHWLWLWAGLFLFTGGRQLLDLYRVPESNSQFVYEREELLAGAERIYLYRAGDQEMQLYADWYATEVWSLEELRDWEGDGILLGSVRAAERESLMQKISFTSECKADFCILIGSRPTTTSE